ncbi:hypothetical protein ACHAXR_007450 [Thalassiosira sp. AJA248-18]
MRNQDRNGDGQLTNSEVYRIVQDQLRTQNDVRTYRKVAMGLVCLMVILALSNFGTSWASAILSKDTVADSESGTLQSKETGEVMGLQSIAHVIELDNLSEEEFESRKLLVDEAIEADPDHEDHAHRRLGKKKNKNKCNCSKIAYDNGKIKEGDLYELTRRCDGVNTINMKRIWRDREGSYDEDYDAICGPGTVVVRKGKKKKNTKNKKEVREVEERVTFRQKRRDRVTKDIHFECDGGYW